MKNLIKKIGIEKLEILPIETLSFKTPGWSRKWYHRDKDRHDTDGISPYDRAERIIQFFMHRSFSEAFTKYCSQVPKYQQWIFLDEFKQEHRWQGILYCEYYIDEWGNIQSHRKYNEYKGPYTITSKDYKVELRHKVTGHKKDDFEKVYEKKFVYIERPYYKRDYWEKGKFLYYEYGADPFHLKPAYKRYIAYEKDFEPVIIDGWEKKFDSKNDREFQRIMAERLKQRNKISRREKRLSKKAAYSFISKDELKLKEEKEINKYKILKHGFDLETSFRNEKQTNPDLIKEKQ